MNTLVIKVIERTRIWKVSDLVEGLKFHWNNEKVKIWKEQWKFEKVNNDTKDKRGRLK